MRRPAGALALIVFLAGALAAAAQEPSGDPGPRPDAYDPNRPVEREFAASAGPSLAVVLVGSLLLDSPEGAPPPFDGAVRKLLLGADRASPQHVTIGVLEGPLADVSKASPAYPYPWETAPAVRAAAITADRLKAQGFSGFMRATGHALDWGIEGERATARALEAAGLAQAGAGEALGRAAHAGYVDEPSGGGRVALVAATTSFRPTSQALAPRGAAPGRPGVSGIELAAVRLVSPDQLRTLQGIACRYRYPGDPAPCAILPQETTVTALGSDFRAESDPARQGTSAYEINLPEADFVLGNIREGKENADLLVASLHAAQIEDERGVDPPVPDFLKVLAHAEIDAGADQVVVTGRPELGAVELYQAADGRRCPIFYGLGNFAWTAGLAPPATVAHRFDGAILRSTEGLVDIFPLDLADGWPHLAEGARAEAILQRLRDLSRPFGTQIATMTQGAVLWGRISYAPAAGRPRP